MPRWTGQKRVIAILCAAAIFAAPPSYVSGKSPAGRESNEPQSVHLRCRIVDTSGRPVAKATARVITATDERKFETEAVSFDGNATFPVDAHGELLTPPLPFDKPYVIEVSAPGMLPSLSRWSRSSEARTVKLPDVVLRRLIPVSGQVLDRNQRPVTGATVSQSGDGPARTEATSGPDGRFEISGVPEGPAFLFAEKQGFRFLGQAIVAGSGPVRFVLERGDDPHPRTLVPLAAPTLGLSREERLDLAYRVLLPRLAARRAASPPHPDFWLTRELANANLPAALDYLELLVAGGVSQADRDQQVEEIATAVAASDPNEALALAEGISDPTTRWSHIRGMTWEIDLYAPRSSEFELFKSGRLAWETAVMVRAVPDPCWRVSGLSDLAGKLAADGKLPQARLLLEEARAALQGLDSKENAWFFAHIAATDALIDSEGGEQKLRDLRKDADFWRLLAGMQISRLRPRQVEELLTEIDIGQLLREERAAHPRRMPLYCTSCDELAQVCIQMAPADPVRAERIAAKLFESLSELAAAVAAANEGTDDGNGTPGDLISPVEVALLKGVTLARMSERIASVDPETAGRWLAEAAAVLQSQRTSKSREGWLYSSGPLLATLLPVACRLDPALAHEIFWRALSLRQPPPADEGRMRRADDGNLSALARLLGRYDLGVARQLLGPLVENNRGEFFSWSPADFQHIQIDGEALLERAREFAASPFEDALTGRERLRLEVARRLSFVQNQIERDWPDFVDFEVELLREQCGLNFHSARFGQ